MKTSAAAPLLLAFCLVTKIITLNAKGEENPTKDSITGTDQKEVVLEEVTITRNGEKTEVSASAIAEEPARLADQILSLLMDERNATKRHSKRNVDQSQSLLINVQDAKELENLEDALSVIEYEPQRITSRKTKRKTQRPANDLNDPRVLAASNGDSIKAAAEEIYHKIPPNVQGYDRRKHHESTVEDSQRHYLGPVAVHGSEPINSAVARAKPKYSENRNVQVIQENYLPIKKERLKPTKARLQANSEFSPSVQTSTKKVHFDDVPRSKIAATLKSYPRSSGEPRKARYSSDANVAEPTNTNSQSARTTRRKKRRRVVAKPSTQVHVVPATEQASENIDRNNVNITPSPAHSARELQRQDKPQAFGALSKYDVAPWPFALAKSHAEDAEGTTKRQHKYVTLNRNRTPGRSPPKRKNVEALENDNYALPYAKMIDSAAGSLVRGDKNVYGTPNVELTTGQNVLPRGERITAYDYSDSQEFLPITSSTKTYERPDENPKSEDLSLERYSARYEGTRASPPSTESSKHTAPQTIYYASSSPHSSNWAYVPNVGPTKSTVSEVADLTSSNSSEGKASRESEADEVEASIGQYVKKLDSVVEGTNPAAKREKERPRSHGGYKIYELPAEGRKNGDESKAAESSGQDYRHSGEESHGHGGYGSRKTSNDDHRGRIEHGHEGHRGQSHDGHDDEQAGGHEGRGHASVHGHEAYNKEESRGNEKKGDGGGGAKGDDGGKGKDDGDHDYESGGNADRSEEHREADGEKGEKGYKSWHEHDKANKGHHDKERHTNYYDEKDGEEKEHEEDGAYHEEHRRGEKAEKGSEFGEKGEHQKGHSTKGQHFIHKKDEFEKRTEFFDEFSEEGGAEKGGEEYAEHEASKGGNEKSRHLDAADHAEKYGEKSEHAKGKHYHEDKGHKTDEGQESHYDHGEKHGNKGAKNDGKKWAYEKPGKEAKSEKSR